MDSGYCEFGVVLKEILNGRDQKDLARESGLADTIISLMMSGDSARLTRRNVLKCIKGLAKLRAIELDREKPHQANKLLQTASKSRTESSKDKKPFDRVELDEYSPVDKEVLEFIDRERQAFEQEQRAQDYLTTKRGLLIGRGKAIEAVYKKLKEANREILVLTGPPGIGKTELAYQIEQKAQEDTFFERVCFVYLGYLDSTCNEDDIIATIVSTLKIERIRSTTQSEIARLIEYLQNKRVLLILDNCEHVATAVKKLVNRLFAECEQLKVLATSRKLFYPNRRRRGNKYMRNEYEVLPLHFPRESEYIEYIGEDEFERYSPEDLLKKFAAIALFVNCAKEADEKFVFDEQNAREVVIICAALNGNPLAIKIIASFVKQPGLPDIIRMLKDEDKPETYLRLKDPFPDKKRHENLTNLYDWSYSLLDETDQKLLRYLAIFDGGCRTDIVTSIFKKEFSEDEVLNSANSLAFHKLITYNSRLEITHKTIRDYALSKLREEKEEREEGEEETYVRKQHRDYYLWVARNHVPPEFLEKSPAVFPQPEALPENWLSDNKETDWPGHRLLILRNFRIPSNTPVKLWRGRDHFVAYTGACLLVVLVDLPLLEMSLQEHDNFYKAMKWTFEHNGIDGWEALCYLYHIWYLPLDLAHWYYEVMPPYAEDSKAAGKENKPDLLICFKAGLLTNALPAEEPGYYTLEVYPTALPCISPEQQWLLTQKIEPIDFSLSTVQTIWYGMLDTDSYDG